MPKVLENNSFKLMANELYLFCKYMKFSFRDKMKVKHGWSNEETDEMLKIFHDKMIQLPEDEKGN